MTAAMWMRTLATRLRPERRCTCSEAANTVIHPSRERVAAHIFRIGRFPRAFKFPNQVGYTFISPRHAWQ
jgi:hypothetical protein